MTDEEKRRRHREACKAYRLRNQDQCRAYRKAYCASRKPWKQQRAYMKVYLAQYYKENRARITDQNALYRSKHRSEIASRVKSYYLTHKSQAAESVRKYEQSQKGIEKTRQRRQENKDSANRRLREWKKRHRGRVNADSAKRLAAQFNATPAWADLKKIASIYESCALVSLRTGIRHEVDHIVPLRSPIVCGLHVETNLQVLTCAENRKKSNRHHPYSPAERLF